MSVAMESIWDGERHEIIPPQGATLAAEIVKREESEAPYETPTVELAYREDFKWDEAYLAKFPMRALEQAWGAIVVSLRCLAEILQIEIKPVQENSFADAKAKDSTTKFIFQTKQPLAERL